MTNKNSKSNIFMDKPPLQIVQEKSGRKKKESKKEILKPKKGSKRNLRESSNVSINSDFNEMPVIGRNTSESIKVNKNSGLQKKLSSNTSLPSIKKRK